MLRYLGLPMFADRIANAIHTPLDNPETRTVDIGGNKSTTQFTESIIHNLKW